MSNYIKSMKKGYYAFASAVVAAAAIWVAFSLHADKML